MTEVFEAARTVLAVREYKDKPVPAETVSRIVESARLTGSSINLQPWRFIVVQDRQTLKRLGELARSGPYTAQAAFAVVVVVEKTQYAVSDASRAVQTMVLTAWAEGVGSNWVGFGGLDAVKKLLGVPTELDVFAIVPFGYPAKKLGQGTKKRKPASEVLFSERYGTPFA